VQGGDRQQIVSQRLPAGISTAVALTRTHPAAGVEKA
jgi:hypothetical protein